MLRWDSECDKDTGLDAVGRQNLLCWQGRPWPRVTCGLQEPLNFCHSDFPSTPILSGTDPNL